VTVSIGYVRAGRLRALAVTTSKRSEVFPELPTVAEFVPGYEASFWPGVGAPRNTPAEIITKLNRAINSAIADPKMKARFAELDGAQHRCGRCRGGAMHGLAGRDCGGDPGASSTRCSSSSSRSSTAMRVVGPSEGVVGHALDLGHHEAEHAVGDGHPLMYRLRDRLARSAREITDATAGVHRRTRLVGDGAGGVGGQLPPYAASWAARYSKSQWWDSSWASRLRA